MDYFVKAKYLPQNRFYYRQRPAVFKKEDSVVTNWRFLKPGEVVTIKSNLKNFWEASTIEAFKRVYIITDDEYSTTDYWSWFSQEFVRISDLELLSMV